MCFLLKEKLSEEKDINLEEIKKTVAKQIKEGKIANISTKKITSANKRTHEQVIVNL